MIPSSPLFCDACGAANQTQATLCWACGQPLDASVEDTTPTSSTFAPPAQQPAPAASAQAPVSHALLAGRYRIVGMVGKGGYGGVYKAEDVQRHDALVAIKSINLSHLSSEEIIEATDTFNREMLLLSDLQHPNLPRIYDHFTDREHWYLAMDFIEGETLEVYLDHSRQGYLPVEEVLTIGVQLCTVLHYLHTRQPPIIFRDVKPGNIMRTASGQLYLIDFGIARRFHPGQKRDTTVLGSPGYAPPEQYGRAQTTVQSDIYSLGATLQTLLTGKEPLELSSGYGPPYPQGQVIPVALALLLGHMLDANVSRRPASMDVVKQALQRIQDELFRSRQPVASLQQKATPAGIARQTLQPPATRAARRGISRRGFTVGLAVGLAIGGIAWMFSQASQNIQSPQTFPQSSPQSPQSLPLLYTYSGHAGGVEAVAWSPDGKRIASGSVDNTVQVWDAADGGHVYTYRGHSSSVLAVAWSPDGKRIASGSGDKTVQIWDAADGGHVYTYRGHPSSVLAVAWSPDGKRIASASLDKTVQVWDAANGGHVFTFRGHADIVLAVAWSPDGKHIASGSDDTTVQVWDAVNGSHVFTFRGHAGFVHAVAWSPDGKHIASSSDDKTVQVWDAINGSHVFTFRGHADIVLAVAWSSDGKRIASASTDSTVQVWKAP